MSDLTNFEHRRVLLAESGSTGNNTHDGVAVPGHEAIAFQIVAEAVGATPTITWKIQGSLDGTEWYDLAYVTDASDTAATAARTFASPAANDGQIVWLSNPVARKFEQFRAVTSANTNVTYRVEALPL